MAEFSAPFDESPIATQSQWSRMARRWGLDGVHAADTDSTVLKVAGNGTGNVVLQPGEAFVNGFYYLNDAVKNIAVTPNAGTVARIDLVVLRASMSAKSVVAAYKTGGTSAPALAADEDGVYEIPLAQCTVAAGSSVVTAVNVADRRWFTSAGTTPGIPGARRPSVRGRLLTEGTRLYVGDGAGWQWIGSPGVEEGTYTPQWSSGSTNFHWGSTSINRGLYQVRGRRVDLSIQVVVASDPGGSGYADPLNVALPPGYPCTTAYRSLFHFNFFSNNGEGSAVGLAMTYPDQSTTKIARLRYSMTNGSGQNAVPNAYAMYANTPFNIRPGDIIDISGSYWTS
ncbi:hypothetical protein [Streptomyces bacillaris]|uniref:hypothetical protein n=1 Tax=Streptomyces bacillaris TaxID=68179 RepID=UPI003EBD8589